MYVVFDIQNHVYQQNFAVYDLVSNIIIVQIEMVMVDIKLWTLICLTKMYGRIAPYTTAMDTFRWGSGVGEGMLLWKWEHNNNNLPQKR